MGQERWRCFATGLLNHVRDVNFRIHDFAELPPLVPLQELKNVVVYLTRCPERAEISSLRALHRETYDGRTPQRQIDQDAVCDGCVSIQGAGASTNVRTIL